MELQPVYYDPADMAVTSKGHKVSRSCILYGTQNIVLSEHTILMAGCIVRGDLACVRMGRYCVVQDRTVIRPSYKQFSKGFTYFPMNIGEHVFIEQDCVLAAISIGSYVHIGRGSVIGPSVTIKDCCYVMPDSVVTQDTVIPAFSIVGGNPARIVGELPPTNVELMKEATTTFYDLYLPLTTATKQRQMLALMQ